MCIFSFVSDELHLELYYPSNKIKYVISGSNLTEKLENAIYHWDDGRSI